MEKQGTGNCEAYPTLNSAPQKNVDQVSQDLCRDDDHGQSPSPNAASEPTDAGNEKDDPEQ
jgi:hypothetical protein